MTSHEGIEWPDMALFSDTPVFNTKAVVQQTGIAAPTLRAWERRYDLLSPERAHNTYRLYSARDVALIHWLKARIDTSISISQAIALFHHMDKEHQRFRAIPATIQTPAQILEDTPTFQVTKDVHITPLSPTNTLPQEPEKETQDPPLRPNWSPPRTTDNDINYTATYNMSLIREHLIEAFRRLDEPTATMMMGSMLTIYPVEQVCTELITPTLWEIGELWANGQITVSVEHFASNFFRALLTNIFLVTSVPRIDPLTIVCCAPGEPHELAALMLALFLRRQHVRVAYLGQSIEINGLLHTIKKLAPALVCISLTMPDYLPALTRLATEIQQLPAPRPIFSFGGQGLAHYAQVIPHIPGVHLKGDLKDIVVQLHRMVVECLENKN
jgi:DNA-binding transcriptional MerR regulator